MRWHYSHLLAFITIRWCGAAGQREAASCIQREKGRAAGVQASHHRRPRQAGWGRGGNRTMTAAAGAATSPAMWSGSISEPRPPPAIWAILMMMMMMMASLVLARPPTMTQYSSARVEHFLKARYQLLYSLCDTWSITISSGMRSTVLWCLLSSVIFPTFSISTSPTLACTPRIYHG